MPGNFCFDVELIRRVMRLFWKMRCLIYLKYIQVFPKKETI